MKKQRNVEAGGRLGHFNTQNSGSDLNLPMPFNTGDTTSSSSTSDHHSSMGLHSAATLECLNTLEERPESIQMDFANRELTIHGQIRQQLACASSSSVGCVMTGPSKKSMWFRWGWAIGRENTIASRLHSYMVVPHHLSHFCTYAWPHLACKPRVIPFISSSLILKIISKLLFSNNF